MKKHPYSSPEITLRKPYSLCTDVYAIGIMLWEVASLKEPYPNIMTKDYIDKVINGKTRPRLYHNKWSKELCNLIGNCWDDDPSVRPTMDTVYNSLDHEIKTLME